MKKVTLIKTSSEESVHEMEKLSIKKFSEISGIDTFDSVNLRDGRVMMVDDTGAIDGLPVNPKGTEFYHSICRPGAPNIHGDVIICNDADWV